MDFEYMKMLAAKDAVKEAEKKVRAEVWKEAMQEGEEKGREEVYISLIQRGVLSLADAVKLSGLSENQFRKHITQ